MARKPDRKQLNPEAPQSLDSRQAQLIYASTVKLYNPVEVNEDASEKLRSRIIKDFSDFSVRSDRGESQFTLKRSGHSQANEEYLLSVKPKRIAVGAGVNISATEYRKLYETVWGAIDEVFAVKPSSIQEFDIEFAWDSPVHGNPYEKAICPAVFNADVSNGLSGKFVFEGDVKIKFQMERGLTEPIHILQVRSQHPYEDILSLAESGKRNEVRVKLGIGITQDSIDSSRTKFRDVAGQHWQHVARAMESGLTNDLIEPILRALDSPPTGKTPARKKNAKRRTKKARR